jgi:hypothetical protein
MRNERCIPYIDSTCAIRPLTNGEVEEIRVRSLNICHVSRLRLHTWNLYMVCISLLIVLGFSSTSERRLGRRLGTNFGVLTRELTDMNLVLRSRFFRTTLDSCSPSYHHVCTSCNTETHPDIAQGGRVLLASSRPTSRGL